MPHPVLTGHAVCLVQVLLAPAEEVDATFEALTGGEDAALLARGHATIETSRARCAEIGASVEGAAHFLLLRANRTRALLEEKRLLNVNLQPPFEYAFCLNYRTAVGRAMLHSKEAARRFLECTPCEAADSAAQRFPADDRIGTNARRASLDCKRQRAREQFNLRRDRRRAAADRAAREHAAADGSERISPGR